MALGTPTLATPTVGTSGTSDVTAAFTPTLGALLVAFGSSRASVLSGALTLGTSPLTWTLLAQDIYDVGAGARIRAAAWAAIVDTAPSMTVTVSSASAGKTCISVVQLTGAGGIPSNAATGINGSGDPSVTLGATPAVASTVLGYFASGAAITGTSPPGYTSIDEFVSDIDLIIGVSYDAGSAAATANWTTGNQRSVAILAEVAEEIAGGASRVPYRVANRFNHMLIR